MADLESLMWITSTLQLLIYIARDVVVLFCGSNFRLLILKRAVYIFAQEFITLALARFYHLVGLEKPRDRQRLIVATKFMN